MHRDLRSGHMSQLLETDEFVSSVKVDATVGAPTVEYRVRAATRC